MKSVTEAWAYAYARELDCVIELYRRAVDLDPENAVCHAYLANALAAVGEADEAVRVAERAVELGAEDAYVRAIEHTCTRRPAGTRTPGGS